MPPPPWVTRRSKLRPVCGDQGSNADGGDCTTRRHNAHELREREVFYPFHPWSGLVVRVREAREHTSGDIFRCTIGSVDGDRGRDLPAWMFDRTVCGLVRSLASPIVDMAALVRLRALLDDALGLVRPDAAASVGVRSGASMGSHDPTRREAHAPTTNSASPAPAPATGSVRSLRCGAKRRSRGARLEGPARDGAPGHHNGVDAVDGRSPTPTSPAGPGGAP